MVEFGAIFKNAYGPYGHIMALSFRRIADLFPIRVCRFFRKDMVPQRSFPVRTLSLDFQVDGRAASWGSNSMLVMERAYANLVTLAVPRTVSWIPAQSGQLSKGFIVLLNFHFGQSFMQIHRNGSLIPSKDCLPRNMMQKHARRSDPGRVFLSMVEHWPPKWPELVNHRRFSVGCHQTVYFRVPELWKGLIVIIPLPTKDPGRLVFQQQEPLSAS